MENLKKKLKKIISLEKKEIIKIRYGSDHKKELFVSNFFITRNGNYAITMSLNNGGAFPDLTIYISNISFEILEVKGDAKWVSQNLISLELANSKENIYFIYNGFFIHFPEGTNFSGHIQKNPPKTGRLEIGDPFQFDIYQIDSYALKCVGKKKYFKSFEIWMEISSYDLNENGWSSSYCCQNFISDLEKFPEWIERYYQKDVDPYSE